MKMVRQTGWASRLNGLQSGPTLLMLYGSQGLTALVGLVYSKVLATYVAPGQFGQYNVQLAGALVVYGCLVTPLIQSFKFSLQQASPALAIRFYGGLLWRGCMLVGAGLAVLMALRWVPLPIGIIWLAITAQCLFSFGTDFLNTTFRHKSFALLQVLSPLLNLLLLVLMLLVWPGAQATGLWVCYALLYATLAGLAFRKAGQTQPGFGLHWQRVAPADSQTLWPAYLTYARPLMVYGLFGWATAYADRYLINYLLTPADVGYYVMGYGLGARMALVAAPLMTYLNPVVLAFYRDQPHRADQPPAIARSLRLFWLVAVPVCGGLFLFRNDVGRLVLSDAYRPAFLIAPLIAIAYSVTLSVQFLETKFYATGYTRYVLWHSMAGATLNVLLNLWLIPRYGISGSAVAMIGSCCCQLAIAYYLFQKTR